MRARGERLCEAVTHIHKFGERDKGGLARRGWGPPSPQSIQGPVFSVNSAKRDPVGRKILTVRKLPFLETLYHRLSQIEYNDKANISMALHTITVITSNPTITTLWETLPNTYQAMTNFAKTLQGQTMRNTFSKTFQ